MMVYLLRMLPIENVTVTFHFEDLRQEQVYQIIPDINQFVTGTFEGGG